MGDNVSENFDHDSNTPAAALQDSDYQQSDPQLGGPPPIPSGPEPVAKPERHPFAFSSINKILFLLVVAYFAITIFARHGITPHHVGRLLGNVIIVILIPWLIARIVWVCTGRRKHGGSLACSIATVAFLLLHILFMSDAQVQERSIRLALRKTEAAKVDPWKRAYRAVTTNCSTCTTIR